MSAASPRKVHTPEVLFPEDPGPRAPRPARGPSMWERFVAGLAIDAANLVLVGPLGLRFGLPVGFLLGFIAGTVLRLGPYSR